MTTTANDHGGSVTESNPILPENTARDNTQRTHKAHVAPSVTTATRGPATIPQYRTRLEQLGFATLPIKPYSKEPVCEGWPERTPADQWHEAAQRYGADLPINIGAVAGNGRAFADCDDHGTRENVRRFLAGLGVTPVEVDSASGGGRGHAYLAVVNVPNGQHIYPFAQGIGRGDLRVGRGSYVLTPPSATGKGRYHFHGSRLEDVAQQRAIDFRDLRPLLAAHAPATVTAGVDSLPVFIPKQPLAEWAIDALRHAAMMTPATPLGRVLGFEAGDPIYRTYLSRSEVEMAVISHAITRGWQLADLRALFEAMQPGHYRAKGRRGESYLARSYRKALAFVAGVPARQRIAELYHAAESRPWPGRTGTTDFLVYRALLTAGYAAAKYEPNLSDREGAAAISSTPITVNRAKKRLTAARVITPLHGEKKMGRAVAYRLSELDAGAARPKRALDDLPGRAELWAVGKLGRSAGQVYRLLDHTPLSVAQLVEATGRGRRTVIRALERLEREGLAQRRGRGWAIGTASAAEIAREWLAPQDHAARVRDLERQQLQYRQWLMTVQRRENVADPRRRRPKTGGGLATKRQQRIA